MTKLLSCLLSFTLLFTSVAPSLAQTQPVRRPARLQQLAPLDVDRDDFVQRTDRIANPLQQRIALAETNIQLAGVVHAITVTVSQKQALDQMNQLADRVKRETLFGSETEQEEAFTLADYAAWYREQNKAVLDEALGKCTTQQERDDVMAQWKQKTAEKALEGQYKQVLELVKQEEARQEEELKAQLRVLAEAAVTYPQEVAGYKLAGESKGRHSIDPVSEFLPLLTDFGAEVLTATVRKKASGILRGRLQQNAAGCAEKDQAACTRLLRNTAALSILGIGKEDVYAVAKVLQDSYKGPMGAAVIETVVPLLLGMGDVDPEYQAFQYTLTDITSKSGQADYWGTVGGIISLGKWVEVFHAVSEAGGPSGGVFAAGYESSFYKGTDRRQQRLENAWLNVGRVVAEESVNNPGLKRSLDRLVNKNLVFWRLQPQARYGFEVGTRNNLFLTGLLAGGYHIRYEGEAGNYEMDNHGQTRWVADSREAARTINQKLQALNMTQSEWVAYALYHTGKTDLDPYTDRYIRNQLYGAFRRADRPASSVGMNKRENPTQQEISNYQNWQTAHSIASVADIAITVVFAYQLLRPLLAGLSKAAVSGVQMGRTITRATRLARSASKAQITRLSSTNRVLRAARYYKYGTSSSAKVFLQNSRTSLGKTLGYRLTAADFAPKTQVIPLKPAQQAVQAPKASVAEVGNGTLQLVPQGYRPADFAVRLSEPKPQGGLRTVLEEPSVAEMPAPAVQNPAAPATPRWIEVETTNALGNRVTTWKPNPAHPQYNQILADLAHQSAERHALKLWDKVKLNWEVNWKPSLQHMFQFGKSRYGLAALGPGAAPVTSEAAIARALDAPAVVQTVRAQQGMFIMEDALRGGSGAAYRTGAVNPGGVASQNHAAQLLETAAKPNSLAGAGYLTPATLRGVKPWLKAAALVPTGLLGASLLFGSDAGLADGLTSLAMAPILFPSFLKNPFVRARKPANDGTENIGGGKPAAGKSTSASPVEQLSSEEPEVVQLSMPATRMQRMWARVAQVPGLGMAKRWAVPNVFNVPISYTQVWYNAKTQTLQMADPSKTMPVGFRSFTISQSPLFVAAPKVPQSELEEVRARLTQEAQKEAEQTGKAVDQKTLQARIEQEQRNLPAAIAVRKANLVAQYVLNSPLATRDDFLWVLASDADASYKVQAGQKMNVLGMAPVTLQELLEKRVSLQRQVHLNVNLKKDELSGITERVSSRLQQESLGQLVPQEDPLLSQGLTFHEMTNVDQARLTEALYPQDGMEDLLRHSTRETVGGNTIYDTVLPVYVRDAQGDISETARLYLLLNKPFTMPRGFMVVIDESGHFKVAPRNLRDIASSRLPYNRVLKSIYKWQPNFADNLPWVKNNPRRLRAWDTAARRRVFETPLKASELTALNYILSNRPGQVAVLPTAPNDTFDGLMSIVAILAGADLGASLSSQLKKTFTSEAATTGTSGGGYVSPKVANWFAPLINKYGYYSILRGGFMTMLGISLMGMLSGLWQPGGWSSGMLGLFSPSASTANMVLALAFMSVAMVTASVFSMLAGPILKSTYTDPTVFSSKNMEFTTNKGLSRLLVTAGTGTVFALVKSVFGIDLNWSVLVPVMAGLSLLGLVKLKGSRLYAEHQSLKRDQAQSNEIKLTPEQLKQKKKEEKLHKKQMKAKYNATFKGPLKDITNRLGLIYLTYGNVNSVILGILAGILYSPAAAMYISGAGLFISWLVRKAADKLIKSRVITEDQLTGMSLPLMLAGVVTGLLAPFGSPAMAVFFGLMYLSTPTFGVSENTRMMNYIASHYKAEREKINKDSSLSLAEKEEKLKAVNKEQEAMKVQAAASYNSHNSWGLFPILATTALVALAKDSVLGTQIASYASQWFQDAASIFRMGTDAAPFDVTKAGSTPLDFSIYRLMLLPAVAFGLILNWANLPMIKQGIQRLVSSIAVSQADIEDVENNDIPRDLQIDFKHINATVEELSKEVEELDAAIRPFKDSRTSEERLQGWANRMVWVNNRLTAILRTKPILQTRLEPELRIMRSLSKSFMLLLSYNDVSEGLRQQGAALYQSLGTIKLKNDAEILTAQERFAGLIYELQEKDSTIDRQLFERADQALANAAPEAFAAVLETMAAAISVRGMKNQLLRTGHEVLDEMKLPPLRTDVEALQYVPELKLSTVGSLRRKLHIGSNPAKGIFAGSDVQDYEQAKLLAREMQTMVVEAQRGIVTDGMFEQFRIFYTQAIRHLQKYVKKNADLGRTTIDPRVGEIKKEIDALYRQYLNQEPPAVSLEKKGNRAAGPVQLETAPAH